MNILQLQGEDPQLYRLVAHLVMNQDILSSNNNYPFRTSAEHIWFVATDDERTLGFMPVHAKNRKAVINNYYVENDTRSILPALLKEAIKRFANIYSLESVTHTRHLSIFEQNEFLVMTYWKNYVKMKYFTNEEKRI